MQESDPDLTQPLLIPNRPVFGGRYILQELLGVGGMGSVWRALEVSLRREVALKFLPLSVTRDELAREDLKKEVLLSQELTHPNIIRVHNFEEDPILAAIAMELVEGKTLQRLKAERPQSIFSVLELTPWVAQLCAALAYAHRREIVHRDLKPGNIMLAVNGQVKVLDFGIAASVSEATARTVRATEFGHGGTLAYMSPQQARGEKPTAADDLYSLGATLYECLTGKPPFFRGEIYAQVQEVAPASLNRRLSELDPALPRIPDYWEETILACLAKKREDRPVSAELVATLLIRGDATERISPKISPDLNSRSASQETKKEIPPPLAEEEKPKPAPERSNAWARLAIGLSTRVDIYRKTFGLEGTFKQRVMGVMGTVALLGFIEVAIIDWSGAFQYGGWLHSGGALFKTFHQWARGVFSFWNYEKTALTLFSGFFAVQVLIVFAIKRMIGFGRVAITSEPAGAMVCTSYGKNLGRTPLLLRLMLPGPYRFRLILNPAQHEDIAGLLAKNRTLRLATRFPSNQKPS